jgi:hypothetical protein
MDEQAAEGKKSHASRDKASGRLPLAGRVASHGHKESTSVPLCRVTSAKATRFRQVHGETFVVRME